jgi:hypothetical protein
MIYYFSFSAYTQIISIAISFLSLALSSVKLFYSQRLGKYQEVDPSMKMTLFAVPFILVLIVGPLCNLVLMASYNYVLVILNIIFNMAFNGLVLKKFCRDKLLKNVELLYGHRNPKYEETSKEKIELGKQQTEAMLLTSVFTAWVSPCSVMSNNKVYTSWFLMISSITSIIMHIAGLCCISLFAKFGDLSQISNPTILHCFTNNTNFSEE